MKILAEALGVEYEWLRDGEKVKDSSVGEETPTEPIMITLILQYGADDMDITDLKERCRSAWRAQFGDGAIRSLAVYIKPEDHRAYWVVNGEESGAVEI